jgi:Holliday junction resolvase
MDIIKASGKKQKFKRKKLEQSLKRAGIHPQLAEKVSRKIAKKVRPEMSSEKILTQVAYELQKEKPILAARYNLKRAIMELGPTGYPFERYIAEILKEYGYAVRVGKIIKGHCVSHEIDVVAKKQKQYFMVECKYHNSRGIRSDTKTALYIFARFLDVKNIFHQGWLVTNTKCTSEAVRYAKCVGLKIISWKYPKNESLEYLIEKKELYPITVLPSLTRYNREKLIQKDIILAKDLLKYSINDLIRQVGLQSNIAKKLQKETRELCLPN